MNDGPAPGEMNRETAEVEEAPDLLESLLPDLDLLLAMLLFSKRVHIDHFSMAGNGRAKLDLSGEAINDGFSLLTHALSFGQTRIAQKRAKHHLGQEPEEKSDSFWKALRDFALPQE